MVNHKHSDKKIRKQCSSYKHCEKVCIFPSPAGMSLKLLAFFYSVRNFAACCLLYKATFLSNTKKQPFIDDDNW